MPRRIHNGCPRCYDAVLSLRTVYTLCLSRQEDIYTPRRLAASASMCTDACAPLGPGPVFQADQVATIPDDWGGTGHIATGNKAPPAREQSARVVAANSPHRHLGPLMFVVPHAAAHRLLLHQASGLCLRLQMNTQALRILSMYTSVCCDA